MQKISSEEEARQAIRDARQENIYQRLQDEMVADQIRQANESKRINGEDGQASVEI